MSIDPVTASGGAAVPQTTQPSLPVPPPVVAPVGTGGVSAPVTAASSSAPPAGNGKSGGTSFQQHLQQVQGHSYARIDSGPDRGLYVNESGNSRNGQVFRLEFRDGHELHVYGNGGNTFVVTMAASGNGGAHGAQGAHGGGASTAARADDEGAGDTGPDTGGEDAGG